MNLATQRPNTNTKPFPQLKKQPSKEEVIALLEQGNVELTEAWKKGAFRDLKTVIVKNDKRQWEVTQVPCPPGKRGELIFEAYMLGFESR